MLIMAVFDSPTQQQLIYFYFENTFFIRHLIFNAIYQHRSRLLGLPHPRVNLRHGIKAGKSNSIKYIGETCTACAGTMILEFAGSLNGMLQRIEMHLKFE